MSSEQFTKERLNELRALPLDMKIKMTEARIREWYTYFDGNVAVSMSGGKDSTVLLNITRSIFPEVKAVFSNTGLEYPEIQSFVRKQDNVDIIRPKMLFPEVISNYGYPIISKEVAEAIYYARRIVPKEVTNEGNKERDRRVDQLMGREREPLWRRYCLTGNIPDLRSEDEKKKKNPQQSVEKATLNGTKLSESTEEAEQARSHGSTTSWKRTEMMGNREGESGTKSQFNKEKWLPLCQKAPFNISHYCCAVMKKHPLQVYQREHHVKFILGTMTEESRIRKQAWLRHGCNAFEGSKQISQPMSFWTEQDVLHYILLNHLEIAPVYGDVITHDQNGNRVLAVPEYGYFTKDGDWIDGFEGCSHECSKCQRTGCIFCGFGAHLDKPGHERFKNLAKTHPRQYEYCMGGGQWVDNPKYDPTDDGKPDAIGWINWNPKKIWVPSREGLGMKFVFDVINDLYGKGTIVYE